MEILKIIAGLIGLLLLSIGALGCFALILGVIFGVGTFLLPIAGVCVLIWIICLAINHG